MACMKTTWNQSIAFYSVEKQFAIDRTILNIDYLLSLMLWNMIKNQIFICMQVLPNKIINGVFHFEDLGQNLVMRSL